MKSTNYIILVNPTYRNIFISKIAEKKYNCQTIIIYIKTEKVSNDEHKRFIEYYKSYLLHNPKVLYYEETLENPINFLKIIKDLNIVAVIPFETSTIYCDNLNKLLNLSHNPVESSELRVNKYDLNQKLASNNINSVKSMIITKQTTTDEVFSFFNDKD